MHIVYNGVIIFQAAKIQHFVEQTKMLSLLRLCSSAFFANFVLDNKKIWQRTLT